MVKLSANVFPQELRASIAEVFACHHPQIVLAKIVPPDDAAENSFHGLLPERVLHGRELKTLARYKLTKRRAEFISGRFCAKLAITEYLRETCKVKPALSMDAIEIIAGSGGRPIAIFHGLANFPMVDISISHSGDHIAAMVMERVCGIDLQRPSTALLRVQTRYCREHEKQLLHAALPDADLLERLTILWVAKEAAMKALSYQRMPGFLDLKVVATAKRTANCISLTFDVNNKGLLPGLPEKISVVASTFGDYGLAVCIIDKGEFNA